MPNPYHLSRGRNVGLMRDDEWIFICSLPDIGQAACVADRLNALHGMTNPLASPAILRKRPGFQASVIELEQVS